MLLATLKGRGPEVGGGGRVCLGVLGVPGKAWYGIHLALECLHPHRAMSLRNPGDATRLSTT